MSGEVIKESDVGAKIHRYCKACHTTVSELARRCWKCNCTAIVEQLMADDNAPCIVPSKELCVKHPDLSQLG